MTATASALRMRGISKIFPGVKALSNVNFTVEYGRIHAVVGENGAGKSTLMKILSGSYAPTTGTTEIAGVEVQMRRPADAQKLGIRMVHQELNLVPDLTVAENIYLGRMPHRRFLVDRQAMLRKAAAVLKELEAAIDPKARLGDLPISQQQLVEIAKSYSADPRIIVLDEPTSSLSEHETTALFSILRKMKSQGIAIIYISHRLKEVLDIADDVTILRDGSMIDTRPAAGITAAEMIRLMVGREVANVFPKTPSKIGPVAFKVTGLSDGEKFHDVGFDVRSGEILGLTGLVGAGRTEVAQAIFGLAPLATGRIEINGKAVTIGSPAAAVKAGVAYVPEDRKGDGIVPSMSVRENISLPVLRRLSRLGRIGMSRDRGLAAKYTRDFSIVPPDPERRINLLSGGNQQKAIISRWLAAGPKVLILDEPTRGVDVGAKAEIHRIIGELVAGGMAVVMISSELPEVMGVCDRVVVMRDGRASSPIARGDLTEERIMALATGEEPA
ncbi:D-ribose transporter ATP-binding protein [Agrobacterium tumefaciens]|uniref:Putative ribose/galactose/methyl galactoside import ATP-binding protein 3 n=1 Tax=Agrobacterium fabrum (strain C58 / ATCC 33970) TaxID=176299 RepID=RGMG3_AGRFC|nr:sugar ABC transporter ATP-binding protein [Agrobacterium fabrum]Q8U9B0.2 RecName: Full=Putative ribose/galactose/methyl galactoside import ATP-binding protein 3 [Agrobacterium fabrum str. C58]KEY54475.1 D-ribose transporter ATP-binding protein [Agrobacterium tumefaciens]AAK89589.2 ABC transporter, nucleotide binding/ATPase protein (ribose) [Agrobacterium fabrum str. C58]KJX86367.1 ABC transporter, nucleotide binding/ATPase protein [Agrobacterium tumefaciens]MCX2875929.1 sugar ABC transporte